VKHVEIYDGGDHALCRSKNCVWLFSSRWFELIWHFLILLVLICLQNSLCQLVTSLVITHLPVQ